MKKTVTLKVGLSTSLEKDHLVLHPNEGFDLGLMRVGHPLCLCRELTVEQFLKGEVGSPVMVHVDLLNDCPKETLLLGNGLLRTLGEPTRAVLLFDGERLFVHRP